MYSPFKQQTIDDCFKFKYQGSFSDFNLAYIVIPIRN